MAQTGWEVVSTRPYAPATDSGWNVVSTRPLETPPEKQSAFRQVADIPVNVAKGAVTGIRMIADAFGAGSSASKALRGAEDYIADLLSAQAKNDQAEIARIMKKAEDAGALEQVKAGFQAFSVAPVDLLTTTLGAAIPTIVTALGAKILGAGALVATGASILTGGVMGAGSTKGSIYEETKNALLEAKASPEEAERRAELAQQYGGENLDQILLGTVLGGVASAGPLEKGAAAILARTILNKAAAKEATESVAEKAAKGAIRQRAEAGVKEAVPEFAQAFQEQTAQNIALQREGFDVPTLRGAFGAGTLEALAGLTAGAAIGEGRATPRETKPPAPPPAVEGAPSATGPQPPAIGAGVDISEVPPEPPPPSGAEGAKSPGVDDAGTPPPGTDVGAGEQSAALIERLTKEVEALQAENDARKTQLEKDIASGANKFEIANRQKKFAETEKLIEGKKNELIILLTDQFLGKGGDNVPPRSAAPRTVEGFARDLQAGKKLETPEDVQFYQNNAKAIEAELNKLHSAAKGAAPPTEATKPPTEATKPPEAVTPPATKPTKPTKPAKPTLTTSEADAAEIDSLLESDEDMPFAVGPAALSEEQLAKRRRVQEIGRKYGVVQRADEEYKSFQRRVKDAVDSVETIRKLISERPRPETSVTPAEKPPEEKQRSKQIQKEIGEQEDSIGAEYDKERMLSSFEDGNTVDLYNAAKEGKFPEGQPLGSRRLEQTLNDNNIDPGQFVLSDEFDSLTPEQKTTEIQRIARDIYNALENTRSKRAELPKWDRLTRDGKDVFLANMTENTPEERARAQRQLRTYLDRVAEAQGTNRTETNATPEARIYELNRIPYEKLEGISLPTWNNLSEAVRALFSDALRKYAPDSRAARTAAVQQDYAFKALAEVLKEQQGRTEKRETDQEGVPKGYIRAQLEIAEKQRKESQKKKERPLAAQAPEDATSSELVAAIESGDFKRVLNVIRAQSRNPVLRYVAQRILQLGSTENGLKTRVVIVDSLPNDALAAYDPKEDVVKVTRAGMTNTYMLHEAVHAVTVKTIKKYLTGKTLTDEERDAVAQLNDVMRLAKKSLFTKFENAFKDLYEFVAYAMTDRDFQRALEDIGTEKLEYVQLPVERSLWTDFMQGVARLFPAIGQLFDADGRLKPRRSVKLSGKNIPEKVVEWSDTNALAEVFNAFEQILSVPEAGIEVEPLPAKRAKKAAPAATAGQTEEAKPARVTKKAPPSKPSSQLTDEEFVNETLGKFTLKDRGRAKKLRNIFTKSGFETLVRNLQNERRIIKTIFEREERAGRVKRFGKDLNDVWGQLSRSIGMALDLDNTHVKPLELQVHEQIAAFAQELGVSVSEALSRIDIIGKARHESERREVKFIRKVPLDTTKKYAITGFVDDKGKPLQMSPAAWREYIFKELSRPDLAPTAKEREARSVRLRQMLNAFTSDEKYFDQLELAKAKATPDGLKNSVFDRANAQYAVWAGRTPEEVERLLRLFDTDTHKARVDGILDLLYKLTDKSIELNKGANYWSSPTENVKNFYGWKNYVPYKGKPGQTSYDEDLEFNTRKMGGELQEGQEAFEGRISEAENAVIQIIAEAHQASMRGGRKDLTLAIKNAVQQGILDGKILPEKIKFEERFLGTADLKALGGANKIFHYEDDGSITIIELKNEQEREAIRRSYRTSNPLVDIANLTTSSIGQMHTRYNPAFAPMDFIRNVFTNAFTLGSEVGPGVAGRVLKAMAAEVASGGLYRSWKFVSLYTNGKLADINRLAGGNAPYDTLTSAQKYYRDMQDYVKLGGKVSYLQGIAAKGALDTLMKDIDRSGLMQRKDQIDKFFDIYNDTFELASRLSAFRIMRDEYVSRGESPESAAVHSVETTKNLANFEQVGRYGKEMGALFMFFRPAATGAVRAIDALAPAFKIKFDDKRIAQELAAQMTNAGKRKYSDTEVASIIKSMREQRRNGQVMAASLAGAGAAMFMIALMLAGDDDEGRNRLLTDDMSRWTRYARIFVPGFENPIQIPWGFGPGAFAAAGSQIAAMASGSRVSMGEALSNIATIGLDSFLPLPISRISPTDNFPAFAIDSLLPSVARPFVEYVMNLDGLGREIYNNRQSRYGDAYTGGDNIPELYKSVTRSLSKATDGAVDWSPNTLYFFANSYLDGAFRVFSSGYNLSLTLVGDKEFDVKGDTLIASSFVGKKSNVDAREFSKAEKYIQDIEKRINSLKTTNQEGFSRYLRQYPEEYSLVQYYNKQVNGTLRDLRQYANKLRADDTLTPAERKAKLEQVVNMQDNVKRQIMNGFETIAGRSIP